MQTWLKSNRRALALGLLPLVGLAVAGVVLLVRAENPQTSVKLLAAGLLLVAALLGVVLVLKMNTPRVARDGGELLFYLGRAAPLRVPINVVEGFMLGQGPALLPGEQQQAAQTQTIVVRLAEKAEDFKRRDVKRSLGNWCDGYITIRGTWCEPISLELVERLNRQLIEAVKEKHGT